MMLRQIPRIKVRTKRVLFGFWAAATAFAGMTGAAAQNPSPQLELLRTFVGEFVLISPGRDEFPRGFQMGSHDSAQEQPIHPVTFHHDFAIAKYEVPQNLYEAVMGHNPSEWKGPRNSAEKMTFADAEVFCQRITRLLHEAKLIETNEVIRLPSEAEWEYCCRAGTSTAYSFGDKATADGDVENQASLLDPYAWHTGNAAGNDPPVGALKPNLWGLYDMHGYLWEFTADDWHETYEGAPTDGAAWTQSKTPGNSEQPRRVSIRGGSWKDAHPQLRSAARRPFAVDARDDAVGFRCVRARKSE